VKEVVKEDNAEGYKNTDAKELQPLVQDDERFNSDITYLVKNKTSVQRSLSIL
jgi:hypothetical protein